jgi:hypothetical protein
MQSIGQALKILSTDFVLKVLGGVGTIIGVWAAIRSYRQTRPKLQLMHKTDKGHNKLTDKSWLLEVLVSNHSSQPNSILKWRAWLKNKEGKLRELPVKEGKQVDATTKDVDHLLNATPFDVAPHATLVAHMAFFDLKKPEYAFPLQLKLEAKDRYGKHYSCWCAFPPAA